MLVLVKCYDNKMVTATPHLFHPLVDSALGSKPTKKIDKHWLNLSLEAYKLK